jgi:hypothetical protein
MPVVEVGGGLRRIRPIHLYFWDERDGAGACPDPATVEAALRQCRLLRTALLPHQNALLARPIAITP